MSPKTIMPEFTHPDQYPPLKAKLVKRAELAASLAALEAQEAFTRDAHHKAVRAREELEIQELLEQARPEEVAAAKGREAEAERAARKSEAQGNVLRTAIARFDQEVDALQVEAEQAYFAQHTKERLEIYREGRQLFEAMASWARKKEEHQKLASTLWPLRGERGQRRARAGISVEGGLPGCPCGYREFENYVKLVDKSLVQLDPELRAKVNLEKTLRELNRAEAVLSGGGQP